VRLDGWQIRSIVDRYGEDMAYQRAMDAKRLIADAGTGRLASPSGAVKHVTAAAGPGDVVLVMGTGGDLDLLAGRICAALTASQLALR
jgi:hypothetical protein